MLSNIAKESLHVKLEDSPRMQSSNMHELKLQRIHVKTLIKQY